MAEGQETLIDTGIAPEEAGSTPPAEEAPAEVAPAPEPGTTLEDGTVVGDGHLSEEEKAAQEAAAARPEWLAEKFWDPETKAPRTESIEKARQELEKELHRKNALLKEREGAPDEYTPDIVPEGLDVNEETLGVLKELNLTNEQAKGVLELAKEAVIPALQAKQTELELKDLRQGWGTKTDTEFQSRLGAIEAWARQNLPREMLLHAATSANGIRGIEAMMKADAASQRVDGGEGTPAGDGVITEAIIQQRVDNPLYHEDSAAGRAFVKETMRLAEQMHSQRA